VSLEEVRAAASCIEEHKDEVMAVHRQIEERIACGNPPEIEAKLAESRERRMAVREKAMPFNRMNS